MMLRGNLSSRPFYNDRMVLLAVGALALVAILLTAFNAVRIVSLTSERATVRGRLEATRLEADRIRAQAQGLQGSVDRPTLNRLATASREANQIIDQRTFSWTGLLALLEKTLPMDMRLTGISPRAEQDTLRVGMSVVTRDLDEVDAFIEALGDTGAFYDVAPTEQRLQEDGSYIAVVDASYLAKEPAPSAASDATPTLEGATR